LKIFLSPYREVWRQFLYLSGIIKRMEENEYLSYEKCIFAGKWLRKYTFFAFRLAFWAKMNNFAPDFNGS